jgi:hypothetical protein
LGIVASISLHYAANACVWGNVFMRHKLFRKGDDRRGLIGAKLEASSRNSTVIQSRGVIGYILKPSIAVQKKGARGRGRLRSVVVVFNSLNVFGFFERLAMYDRLRPPICPPETVLLPLQPYLRRPITNLTFRGLVSTKPEVTVESRLSQRLFIVYA